MPVITPHTISLLTPHVIDLVKTVWKARSKDEPDKDMKPGPSSQEQAIENLNRDVAQLQDVASRQAEAIAEIAQKVEQRLVALERQVRLQKLISLASVVVAVVAAGIALAR